jgi:hypothetical protein
MSAGARWDAKAIRLKKKLLPSIKEGPERERT